MIILPAWQYQKNRRADQEGPSREYKVVFVFSHAAAFAGLSARVHLAAAEKARVWGDSIQFHQILMNLFTNAGYAMKETGGRLDVTLDTLHVKLVKPG